MNSATFTTTTLTITRNSHIGISWTKNLSAREKLLGINTKRMPDEYGDARYVWHKFNELCGCNHYNDWQYQWFVWRDYEWCAVDLDECALEALQAPYAPSHYLYVKSIEANVLGPTDANHWRKKQAARDLTGRGLAGHG